jgi:hypothetical protein
MGNGHASGSSGIDQLFGRARRLLLGRSAVGVGLFVVCALHAMVLASVCYARHGGSLSLLRLLLPLGALALALGTFVWVLAARSSERLRRRVVRFLAGRDPIAHADIEAYYASHLIGGIRDDTVREICRERLARHLFFHRDDLGTHRFGLRGLFGWAVVVLLLWAGPWVLGMSPMQMVRDFRRVLGLRSAPLVVTRLSPAKQWLPPHDEIAVRVTFSVPPMGSVDALVTDEAGQVQRLALRSVGEDFVGTVPTPGRRFLLQLACEDRTTPAREYNVYPAQVVSLQSVDAVDSVGVVTATYRSSDFPITVREGQRLRWYLETGECPLREHGLGSREAVVGQVKARDHGSTWECVVQKDAEFFTFWEAPGEAPVVQATYQVQMVADEPPKVELVGPEPLADGTTPLPMDFAVSVTDDSGISGGVLTVADLRGWQTTLPLEFKAEAEGWRAEVKVTETTLDGHRGPYLAAWTSVGDNGSPINVADSPVRFYRLPAEQSPAVETSQESPADIKDEQAAETELAEALASNLDRLAEQAEQMADTDTPSEGPEGQSDERDVQPGDELAQNDPPQSDEDAAPGEEQAQNDQPAGDQPQAGEDAAPGEEQAQNGQPAGDQPQAGEGGMPGGEQQAQNGQPAGDQPQAGEGGMPGGEQQAQNGQPAGDQPQAGEGEPPQEQEAQNGLPGGDQPQAGEGDMPGGEQQAQNGQPGGDQPQAGEGDMPGGEQQAENGQPGQQGGEQQAQNGQAGQQAGGEQQAQNGQPGQQGGEQQAENGQPGQQGGEQQAQSGQPGQEGGEQQAQSGQPGQEGGEQQAQSGQPGQQAGDQPGEGTPGERPEGAGQVEDTSVAATDEPPRGEDEVDESLRDAAARGDDGAVEKMGMVEPTAEAGEYEESKGDDTKGNSWAQDGKVEIGDVTARTEGTADDAAAEGSLSAEDLGATDSAATDTKVDLGLVDAGKAGSRSALAANAVETAIRAHEEAMGKLTGAEKAATREYYRRLRDLGQE